MPRNQSEVPDRPPSPEHRQLTVLLVEDDPGDVVIAQEALRAGEVDSRLSIVSDGAQALDFVHRRNAFTDAERPDLILLDLNLPGKSGLDVLEELKSDNDLRSIPVVVLSTSSSPEDVARSYERHANVYVAKPSDFEHYTRVVKQIDDFFASVAQLPPN